MGGVCGDFLNVKNRLNATEELFSVTLTQQAFTCVRLVKRALYHNAASVIFAYNLHKALALVDVRVLDHFIVARNQTLSFAEQDLL